MGATAAPAVTGIVRSLDAEGTDVYVGTDALDVAGIAQADHVARWTGSTWNGAAWTDSGWSALGANTAGTNGWLLPPRPSTRWSPTTRSSWPAERSWMRTASRPPTTSRPSTAPGGDRSGPNGAGDGPVPAEVHALRIYQRHLYAGGNFTTAGGDSRAKFLAAYPLLLADNAISLRLAGSYAGGDVYDIDGKGEVRTASVRKGRSGRFFVRIQNDGLTPGSLRVSGVGGASGIQAHYFLQSTGADITSAVRSGNYFTGALAANGAIVLRMRVDVARNSAAGTTFRITSGPTGGGELDTVRAVVTTRR